MHLERLDITCSKTRCRTLAHLRVLDVADCGLTATGLRAILLPFVENTAQLEYLDVSNDYELGNEGAPLELFDET